MGMHEWYSIMYGIEFDYGNIDGNKVLSFIENHKERFENEGNLPNTVSDAVDFAEDFECEGNIGVASMISFVANNNYICAESDEYGNSYIGIFAYSFFPWDEPCDDWKAINRHDVENEIRSLVEELGIECPGFTEHQYSYTL